MVAFAIVRVRKQGKLKRKSKRLVASPATPSFFHHCKVCKLLKAFLHLLFMSWVKREFDKHLRELTLRVTEQVKRDVESVVRGIEERAKKEFGGIREFREHEQEVARENAINALTNFFLLFARDYAEREALKEVQRLYGRHIRQVGLYTDVDGSLRLLPFPYLGFSTRVDLREKLRRVEELARERGARISKVSEKNGEIASVLIEMEGKPVIRLEPDSLYCMNNWWEWKVGELFDELAVEVYGVGKPE